jgi:hypothetical protein
MTKGKLLTGYNSKYRGVPFSLVFFFVPNSRESKEGETFYCGKVMGWHKKVISISEFTFRVKTVGA